MRQKNRRVTEGASGKLAQSGFGSTDCGGGRKGGSGDSRWEEDEIEARGLEGASAGFKEREEKRRGGNCEEDTVRSGRDSRLHTANSPVDFPLITGGMD